MTAFNLGNVPADVSTGLSKVMAELVLLGKEDPLAAERIAELADGSPRADRLMAAMLQILPAEIDARAWLDWLEGGTFADGATKLIDPDKGRQKSARGAWQSAVDVRDRLARDVAICRTKLAETEQLLARAEQAVKAADAQLRAVVCYRFVIDASKLLGRLFAMGPMFSVGRAISVYQRRDSAFEDALDAYGRDWIDAHLADREDTARRISELLDFFAGDAAVEIKLHHAIYKVLTDAKASIDAEIAEAKRTGARLSKTAKRTIRNYEQRRTSVRREGLRNDYRAVLSGLVGQDPEHTDADAAGGTDHA